MQEFLTYFNIAFGVISTILAFLPFIYLLVGIWLKIFKKQRNLENHKNHKFAVLIPARNESNVIANLISSLKNQNYPSDLFDIYVIADNCTDNTKEVALKAGALVIERHDTQKVGKGYTLDYAIKHINQLSLEQSQKYDAFIFFDADNVVDKDFLKYINIEYAKGYKVVTSYRMPKNYSDSWIAAGSGLMYIRESIFLQEPKRALKISCSISGTGFLVDSELLKDGWKYHLLSEEIQFTADKVINGLKIGNAKDAITYDEQPSDVKTFFRQRLRWAKGTMQVFNKYGGKLLLKSFKSLSSWDIFAYIFPINFLILLAFLVNFLIMVIGYSTNNISLGNYALIAFGFSVGSTYLVPLMFGFITTIIEWKKIKAPFYKKIWYCFLFPILAFFWILIWVWALFQRKLQWKPIKHKDSKNIEQM